MVGAAGTPLYSPEAGLLFRDSFILMLIAFAASTPILKKLVERLRASITGSNIVEIAIPILTVGLLIVAISFTVTSTYNPFIYFNF
jgi:hypothetical protein